MAMLCEVLTCLGIFVFSYTGGLWIFIVYWLHNVGVSDML